MELKPLPIGIQTFRDIINGGFLYVDKTKSIYELIRNPKGVYFLSRPRRFGKSLLISTLDEIFQGNRELFDGLWLYDSPYQWEQFPVVRIDFSELPVENAEQLKKSIKRKVQDIAEQYDLTLRDGTYVQCFTDLIRRLSQKNQVVILIDEYDKPILDNIDSIEEAKRIRTVLKGFYGVLKPMGAYLRFVLLTGVSKFSHVGVFSDLNNLNDLTMHYAAATLTGFTEAEITANFQPHLQLFANERDITIADLQTKIRHWYNGFRFSRRSETVYNPFSFLLLLNRLEFDNYWFATGTPTFLLKLIKSRGYDVTRLEDLSASSLAFSTYEIESLEIVPLLFQTGYLTIKGYNSRFRRYQLGYPNFEVERAFLTYVLSSFGNVEKITAINYLDYLNEALLSADWKEFFEVLNTLLATINYELHIKKERYYQTIFYLIFKLMGLEIGAEVHTNRGRIDAVIETDDAIAIFEFKLDGSADDALNQIKEKGYASRYKLTGKRLYLIGANFEMAQREVIEWKVELGN